MGIVNVTPDSFSDGGQFRGVDAAVRHALQLVADGAEILDVGGESTRPYSDPVGEAEELDRVIPVVKELALATNVPISIDTSKAAVAAAAVEAGAEIINDVTGLEGDPGMSKVAATTKAGVCAMHMQGTPQTMQDDPKYDDVVEEIYAYLEMRLQKLLEAGIGREKICLDPGVGFGKTHEHNMQLVARCERFLELGQPILIGHSRKGFIGKMIGDKGADRDQATLVLSMLMATKGIDVLRVHEVRETSKALAVLGD